MNGITRLRDGILDAPKFPQPCKLLLDNGLRFALRWIRPSREECRTSAQLDMMKTVLIVDDNLEERKIFSTYFEFVGGRVVEAPDGREGLKAARDHRPDLILLDLSMPVMDGWEAIRRLQSDAELRGIPVIAVTAHHLPRVQVEEAGFCGYLEKPLAPYHVLNEVERCLGPLNGGAEDIPKRGVTPTFEASLPENTSLRRWLGSEGVE